MLKAFVGIASGQGLAVLQPEREESLAFVTRSVQAGPDLVGFWAVLDETEARCVRALVVGGRRREAMLFLDRAARDMGRILSTAPSVPLH